MTRSPAEFGIDLMSGEFFGNDPDPAFAWMRRHAPVFHDDVNDLWALARYDDVKTAGTDTATFSSAGGIRPKFPGLPMMIDLDAPEHVRRRKLVSAGFTPRRVQAMEAQVRAVCDEVIDQVCERGWCDFVRDIAAPLPLNVIGDMLGVAREDRSALLRWSEDMLGSQGATDPAGLEAEFLRFGRLQVGEERAKSRFPGIPREGSRSVGERVEVRPGRGRIAARPRCDLNVQPERSLHFCDEFGQRPGDVPAKHPQFGRQRCQSGVARERIGGRAA